MYNQSDLQFLRERIQDLESALFFSLHTSVLKMSTTIVSILKTDELVQVWFYVPRPKQAIQEFDKEFPVKLEFFRKGKGYFLHVTGKAFIITDPEEINCLVFEDIRKMATEKLVLIKVRMGKADYFETPEPSVGRWKEIRSQVYAWLFNTRKGYRPYRLDSPLAMAS